MIKPKCFKCKKELYQFGAILLKSVNKKDSVILISPPNKKDDFILISPPKKDDIVYIKTDKLLKGYFKKYHICKKCYKIIAR